MTARATGRPPRLPPFEQVVERHGPALLRFCAAQVGPERAEDCFQDAMLAALRAYGELRDPGSVRAWLFAIAARKAIDAHRERARGAEPTEDVEQVAIAAPEAPSDGALWARVRGLPDKQRRALSLRYLGDLTHREIGDAMGTSEAAARRNVFEALARLRREVGVG
jgi:RNA polymerase sigma factor (sigma-70 family)